MKSTTEEMDRQIKKMHDLMNAGVKYSIRDNIVLGDSVTRSIAAICGIDVMKWIDQQPTYIDGRGIRRPTIDLDYQSFINGIKSAIPSTFYPKGGTQMEIDKVNHYFSGRQYITKEVAFNKAKPPFYNRWPLYLDSEGRAIKWHDLNEGDMKKLLALVKPENND